MKLYPTCGIVYRILLLILLPNGHYLTAFDHTSDTHHILCSYSKLPPIVTLWNCSVVLYLCTGGWSKSCKVYKPNAKYFQRRIVSQYYQKESITHDCINYFKRHPARGGFALHFRPIVI